VNVLNPRGLRAIRKAGSLRAAASKGKKIKMEKVASRATIAVVPKNLLKITKIIKKTTNDGARSFCHEQQELLHNHTNILR